MGCLSILMCFFNLVFLVVLVYTFPFAGKGVLSESFLKKYEKQRRSTVEYDTNNYSMDRRDFNILELSKDFIFAPGLKRNQKIVGENRKVIKSFSHEPKRDVLDIHDIVSKGEIYESRKIMNLETSDNARYNSDTGIVPKDFSFNSILKGFLRETIVVPEHRKHQRHRRSFFFGFPGDGLFEEDDFVFSAHTSPCNAEDRHYCLNEGTCVFVGALEIKTCRCKMGYTGVRCEMINQEYILLALLSGDILG
ncbi:hypothetical protein CHS0354_029105 [Potamilus streckersoni]|uniref:EGF-like domain-containing protein n=1 Tax=Potamilus streckersoni TaxID=2493646 RepID=A0AAE0SXL2_9BIVA|nr:hypothetical protein CHS0354_029105 [Potamilus streckersoni]